MSFLPSFLRVVPHGLRKPLFVCSGMIREMQKFTLPNPSAFHNLSALFSSSKERRNEEWGTCPLGFLLPLVQQKQSLLIKRFCTLIPREPPAIRCHTSEVEEATLQKDQWVQKDSESKSFITPIAWTALAKRSVLLLYKWKGTKKEVIHLVSNLWKLHIGLWGIVEAGLISTHNKEKLRVIKSRRSKYHLKIPFLKVDKTDFLLKVPISFHQKYNVPT